jgi:hypothetical protein
MTIEAETNSEKLDINNTLQQLMAQEEFTAFNCCESLKYFIN